MSNTIYSAAAYLRLSREDGDKLESDSISTQRMLLSQFIDKNPDISIVREYIDDGFTGTNFNRPEFSCMIQDIEDGKINCVIVKDLSRFGRDYIETGRFLERYFPERDIRFVAINDNIDSYKKPYDMVVPFKNIFNEQYARDISTKVQSAFKAKQNKGEFIGAFAGYGYKKDDNNKHKLVIDEYAAAIVRKIFNMYVYEGKGQISISTQLNKEGVLCPSEYKKQIGLNYTNGRKIPNTTYWTYATIHRLLKNEMYIGNMVQGKSVRKTHNAKAKSLPEDKWIKIEDTHEPIIDIDTWNKAQILMNKNVRDINFNSSIGLFSGFIICGDCERAMSKCIVNGVVYYKCGSYKRYGSSICTAHTIRQDVLAQIVKTDINNIISTVSNLKESYEKLDKPQTANCNLIQIEINKTQVQLDKIKRLRQSLYEDYKDGILSKTEYLEFKQSYEQEEVTYTSKLTTLQSEIDRKEESPIIKPWALSLLKHGKVDTVDRQIVLEFLEKIIIYNDNVIKIVYNFSNDLDVLLAREDIKIG